MGIARGSSSLPIRTNLKFRPWYKFHGVNYKQAKACFLHFRMACYRVVSSKATISLDENRVSLYNALQY